MTDDGAELTEEFDHITRLCCPECYPDCIETVLMYGTRRRSVTIKCKNCGHAGPIADFEEVR